MEHGTLPTWLHPGGDAWWSLEGLWSQTSLGSSWTTPACLLQCSLDGDGMNIVRVNMNNQAKPQSNEFQQIECWINVVLFGIWYYVSLWDCECNIVQFGDDMQALPTLSVLQAWFSRGLYLPCSVSWWQSWKQRSCPRISRWLLPKIVANRTASRGRPAEVSDFDAGIWICRSFARILVGYLLAVLRAWLMGPRPSL